jgi:hypothetical protein
VESLVVPEELADLVVQVERGRTRLLLPKVASIRKLKKLFERGKGRSQSRSILGFVK